MPFFPGELLPGGPLGGDPPGGAFPGKAPGGGPFLPGKAPGGGAFLPGKAPGGGPFLPGDAPEGDIADELVATASGTAFLALMHDLHVGNCIPLVKPSSTNSVLPAPQSPHTTLPHFLQLVGVDTFLPQQKHILEAT